MRHPKKPTLIVVVAALISSALAPQAIAQPDPPSITERFASIDDLLSRGQFNEAIEALGLIIREFSVSDDIMRRAYHKLVHTLVLHGDYLKAEETLAAEAGEGDRVQALKDRQGEVRGRIGEVVGEALDRFPDLAAPDDMTGSDRINTIYEPVRQQKFGGLIVRSEPDSAEVWIGGDDAGWRHEGFTPLERSLYPIGTYELKVTKSGYGERLERILIQSNRTTDKDFALDKNRSKTWWLTRVVSPVAAVAAVLTYALTGGDAGAPDEAQPLPDPPPPPTQ